MSLRRSGVSAPATRPVKAVRVIGPRPGSGVPDLADELLTEEMALLLVRFGVGGTARRLGVSERTLRRDFVRAGASVHDHISRTRRAMAVRLLASSCPLARVAEEIGFASSQTFARFVAREFGFTPSALRKSLRWRAGIE